MTTIICLSVLCAACCGVVVAEREKRREQAMDYISLFGQLQEKHEENEALRAKLAAIKGIK